MVSTRNGIKLNLNVIEVMVRIFKHLLSVSAFVLFP